MNKYDNNILINQLPYNINKFVINLYDIMEYNDRSYFIKNWTIYSLKKALSLYNKSSNKQYFDIGYNNTCILSCNLNTNKFIYKYKYNFIKKISNDFEFHEWFYIL